MKFHLISIFPEFFEGAVQYGVVGAAQKKGLIELNPITPRQFTGDVHQTVDDRPFGGGDGMVMMAEPLMRSLESIEGRKGPVLVMSPAGIPFSSKMSQSLSKESDLTIVCGRYAGIDQRFVELSGAIEVSVGDYVLSGGEPAAFCVLDSVTRLIPGVLGHPESAESDSFFDGLLESPCYTRPQLCRDLKVPEFLLSGDHKKIVEKQKFMSLLRTHAIRPDLLDEQHLSELEKARAWFLGLAEVDVQGLGMSKIREGLLNE